MDNHQPKSENSIRKILPQEENLCVWMTAGLISYKLCDLGYDCAHCSLDLAMRTSRSPRRDTPCSVPTPLLAKSVPTNVSAKEVMAQSYQQILDSFPPFQQKTKNTLYYHPQYTWVEPADKNFKVGLDPFLLSLLEHVDVIVMPIVGTPVHKGEYFCWLFGDYPPLPIVAPINGMVTKVNTVVRSEPETLLREPGHYVWLAEVESTEFDKDKKDLLHNTGALDWRDLQIKRLKDQFSLALEENSKKVGATLQDGGTGLTQIKDILGMKKYYDIVFRYLKKI